MPTDPSLFGFLADPQSREDIDTGFKNVLTGLITGLPGLPGDLYNLVDKAITKDTLPDIGRSWTSEGMAEGVFGLTPEESSSPAFLAGNIVAPGPALYAALMAKGMSAYDAAKLVANAFRGGRREFLKEAGGLTAGGLLGGTAAGKVAGLLSDVDKAEDITKAAKAAQAGGKFIIKDLGTLHKTINELAKGLGQGGGKLDRYKLNAEILRRLVEKKSSGWIDEIANGSFHDKRYVGKDARESIDFWKNTDTELTDKINQLDLTPELKKTLEQQKVDLIKDYKKWSVTDEMIKTIGENDHYNFLWEDVTSGLNRQADEIKQGTRKEFTDKLWQSGAGAGLSPAERINEKQSLLRDSLFLAAIHPVIKQAKDGLTVLEKMMAKGSSPLKAKEDFLELWKGTYGKDVVNKMIHNATDPKSRETVVLMSPDDFHKLAQERGDWYTQSMDAESRRINVRKGLESPEGLNDSPVLFLDQIGKDYWKLSGHNGRHRMDVFKEQGYRNVPVRIRIYDNPWGSRWGEHKINIQRVLSENDEVIDWRWEPLFKDEITSKPVQHEDVFYKNPFPREIPE